MSDEPVMTLWQCRNLRTGFSRPIPKGQQFIAITWNSASYHLAGPQYMCRWGWTFARQIQISRIRKGECIGNRFIEDATR